MNELECRLCFKFKPLTKFKKYTTKLGELRYVKNCMSCASLERKISNSLKHLLVSNGNKIHVTMYTLPRNSQKNINVLKFN